MAPATSPLKERYAFTDFLYWTAFLSLPVLTALIGILRISLWWTLGVAAVGAVGAAVIYRFYCTSCPHYKAGRRSVRCIFYWGMPKFFHARPGPLSANDKAIAFGTAAFLAALPLAWLFTSPGLLVLYLLSLTLFAVSVRRFECHRCIYFDCPSNTVPEEVRNRLESD
jgi:hypothetical protein